MGERAARFADAFGWAEPARIAGQLHDIGKVSPEFQAYIRGERREGGDHSSAGAEAVLAAYPGPLGRMLAFLIGGHHAGLADGAQLKERLDGSHVARAAGWDAYAGGQLPAPAALRLKPFRKPNRHRGFSEAFLIRMLFSCLVDADFLETERFYAQAVGEEIERGVGLPLPVLRDRLERHMDAKQAGARQANPGRLTELRAEILAHVIARAGLAPGLFTLTVPTGGGKTLASLSFALEHALSHGLRRIVYVIPFTSIIEQTAAVFGEALGADAGSLEHHASFDWETAAKGLREDGRGTDPLDRLRRAAENWDAPVVVTTAVQFFESLFASRTSRCRKLHNLANSVIILDEAQTLPQHLLLPCMAALEELARNYGSSIVLCTATQPALREKDGFEGGFEIDDDRELAPDPERLYRALKRVEVERLPEPIGDEVIAARFAEQPQMLCIVNTRRHAKALFELIPSFPGAVHLTTLMCPRHRRLVLDEARRRLKRNEPVRIVSTSLIEAGVDIDLPEVWRAAAGLDSIAQAAGRCNREFRLGAGRVVVFEPIEAHAPHDLKQAWQAGRRVLAKHDDPLGLEAVRDYFGKLYWQVGRERLDAATLNREIWPILEKIAERAPGRNERDPDLAFPFKSIAEAFRVIEDTMEPVIVPWRAEPEDDEANSILDRIARMDTPLRDDLRRLQQYTVSIPKRARDEWLRLGVLRPVHPILGEALLRFVDDSLYDPQTGVRLDGPSRRSAESNVL